MRVVDTSNMSLVHSGAEWALDADPSSKKMASHLLRNERIVTWLQPEGAGPEDQVPAIRVGGNFCALSVRMMKAIWRDVRLRKGFINLQPLPQGGFRPRIPSKLLQDKQRTQHRFKTMRKREGERKTKERRGMSIMTKRIHGVLKDIILPLSAEVRGLPTETKFSFTDDDAMRGIFERARLECPGAFADRDSFLRSMSSMYDSHHHHHHHHGSRDAALGGGVAAVPPPQPPPHGALLGGRPSSKGGGAAAAAKPHRPAAPG